MRVSCRVAIRLVLLGASNGCVAAGAAAIAVDRAGTDCGEVRFGWSVEQDGAAQVVRWRDCASETECTTTTHERSSGELQAVDTVGVATVTLSDGRSKSVDVKRLTFGPLPPNRPTAATEVRARMNEAAPSPTP